MPTLQRRFSVISGFVILLTVLIANSIIMKRQLSVQIENQEWVAHTRQVLIELSELQTLLRGAEAGQRGYLYTGALKYLAPYNLALSEASGRIDRLAWLTRDNSSQQTRIAKLRAEIKVKLSDYGRTISLYQSGKAEQARVLVLSDDALLGMKPVWQTILEIQQEEHALDTFRSNTYQRSIRVTITCIYVACVLGVLGLVLLAIFIMREMDLRERHAKLMHEREEWFRSTLTSLGDAVIATDKDGIVTFLNPVAEQLTGLRMAHAKGQHVADVFPIFNEYTHQPVVNPVKKVMELGIVVGLANHTVLRHVDGTLTPIEDSAAPIRDDRDKLVGVVLVFRDATRERESQEVLRKTEKLAAAARLAATFAHEINNPLEAVVNLIYIVREIEGLPDAAIQPLDLAEHELERVSHIARQTLGFYRESKIPGQVDLPSVIQNVLKLYSNKLRNKSIRVECDFHECPPVLGLAGELTQMASNLISNAADAVPTEGTIRVHLSAEQDSGELWARMIVEDNGPGINPELKNRIFEPFFTTKADVGTGLGLWVTREIIHRHGGRIEAQSKSGGEHGAIFSILLPSAPPDGNTPAK